MPRLCNASHAPQPSGRSMPVALHEVIICKTKHKFGTCRMKRKKRKRRVYNDAHQSIPSEYSDCTCRKKIKSEILGMEKE